MDAVLLSLSTLASLFQAVQLAMEYPLGQTYSLLVISFSSRHFSSSE